jgi:predicted RecB family nuclease
MQRVGEQTLYSASDLVAFLDCEHRTALDLLTVTDNGLLAERTEPDENAELIARKGDEHERRHLATLRASGSDVIDIAEQGGDLEARIQRTVEAMRRGVEVIYQATLRDGYWIGHADFLHRVDGRSSVFGDWSYEVADTKLARNPKAKFAVQLAYYSQLVAKAQGRVPVQMSVVLGDGSLKFYRVADFAFYLKSVQRRFLEAVTAFADGRRSAPYPSPCDYCSLCHWQARCEKRRLDDDHLSQVAGITRVQTDRLEAAGVATMESLAALAEDVAVPRVEAPTLGKLRGQAKLQVAARRTGIRSIERLPLDSGGRLGWYRLPAPNDGDMYFDMEGDPLQDGGLEYLFGVGYQEAGEWRFRAFWAHDRAQERFAFEEFMDFVTERRRRYPHAHIYHYATYEDAALKRLASLHATREAELDNLLRQQVLVDLYKVVRESVRTSEPGYSIKDIERFYRAGRQGDVTTAGASIVFYERWRESRDQRLLDDIERYNSDDVTSTRQLHTWLRSLRPPELPWRALLAVSQEGQSSDVVREGEARLAAYHRRLTEGSPSDRDQWQPDHHLRELTFQLLDFHRRASKPAWWAVFARMDMDEEQLLDDPECLAGLTTDPDHPAKTSGKVKIYSYLAPEQDTKLGTGDSCRRCDTSEPLGTLEFDEVSRRVQVRVSSRRAPPPPRLSIGPAGPVNSGAITKAIYRFADSLIDGTGDYPAIEHFLKRETPHLRDRPPGDPIIRADGDLLTESIEAALLLNNSYLYVQGPPGAGKTYTGSHMISALLAAGHRVGVMSNSHKAINHLMACTIRVAQAKGVDVRPVKKSTRGRTETAIHDTDLGVTNLENNRDIWDRGHFNLVGGTAWLFCDEMAKHKVDYLFVDEAGQVALANLVSACTSARNIVLLGDQMQLGQPIQGVHPGRSGESALDYLLNGVATIPPDRGVFLATTWRLHPDICRFISDAVYDGRLLPEKHNVRRQLELDVSAHPSLKPYGITFLPIQHDGCSQSSKAEADLIEAIYASALQQRYTDKEGKEHPIGPADILVVAPYNVQVNLLTRTLPPGARVGTVDKFQGQEAPIVIVSMTTSSEKDLPRHIEFLYSRNRLNVAVSRAMCLAVVVANPALTTIRCHTPDQMALVNTLCWLAETGSSVSTSRL